MALRHILAVGNRIARPAYRRIREIYTDYRSGFILRTSLRRPEAIVVHQMGKVGSSSVVASLKASGLDMPIYHTHFLNRERLDSHLRNLRSSNQGIDDHLIASQHLRRQLDEGLRDKKWKIVTLVREPIARNISAFFENIEKHSPNWSPRFHSGSLTMEEMIGTFLDDYPHDIPLDWLDLEIGLVFGIDVFSSDFPKSEGYQVFKGDNVELLLIRLESLRECYHDAFTGFLEIERFNLKNANVARDRDYYAAYEEFKHTIILPPDYIERMYDSKYTQHFYSEEEINILRARWSA